jgi:hypothetical protein
MWLIQVEIAELDPEEFDPGKTDEFTALCLLGNVYNTLLQPFVSTELSSSEQIGSLVTFAHLLCALYIKHGTSFSPESTVRRHAGYDEKCCPL